MPQYQEKTTVTRAEKLSEDNIRLTLFAPDIASTATPGQFVMIKSGTGKDPLLRRPFSIHQSDANGHIQIYFKIVGRGTEILAQAREGEEMSVFGPLGQGFELDESAPVCIIGGGLGIAPMLFLAKEICQNKTDCSQDIIILGGRTESEVEPLIDDFKEIGMQLVATTDDGSYGQKGYVTEVLQATELAQDTKVYGCGPEPMMSVVHSYCEKAGYSCQVSVESVMACGMGACLGCNREAKAGGYVHVCLDGPVFESGDLKWEL